MGVPDRAVMYENCSHGAHGQWSASGQVSQPLQQQQQQQQHQQQQQQQQHHQQQYDRVPPPPYPGHSKQHVFSNLPGFRQSYSGSDTSTDMSLSSTENLAAWPRQEPQGEETTPTPHPHPHPHPHPSTHPCLDSSYNNGLLTTSRLPGMTSVAESPRSSMERLSASPGGCAPCSSSSFSSSSGYGHSQSGSATSTSSGGDELSSSGGSGSLRQQQQQQQQQQHQQHLTVPQHVWQGSQDVPPPHSGRYFRSLTPTYHHPHPYVNQNWTVGELCGGQSGGSQVLTYVPFLPPPPQYPGHRKEGGGGCEGKVVGQSRYPSDPAVSSGGGGEQCGGGGVGGGLVHRDSGVFTGHSGSSSYLLSDTIFTALKPGSPRVRGASHGGADHVVNLLNEENRRLQDELVQSYKKIAKLQKLEQEIAQVQEAYQSLVRSTDKRERLEAAIKNKLQEEVLKLQSQNHELKAQVQKAGSTRKLRSRSEGRGQQREKESVASLKQLLQDRHAKVEQLESEIEQWELRYSELQAAQLAGPSLTFSWCDCPSAMAKNSQKTTQRLHAEAEHDKLQQAEEFRQSRRRIAELEAKVTCLTSQLADKEETLKTHRHLPPPLSPDASSSSTLHQTHSPHLSPSHSPDPSFQSSCSPPSPASPQAQNKVQLWQV